MQEINQILSVEYSTRLKSIRFRVQWEGTDHNGRRLHPSNLFPENIFHSPDILLESVAWKNYLSSEAYTQDKIRDLSAFEIIQCLLKKKKELAKKKENQFPMLVSINLIKFESQSCPICFDDFTDSDTIVSVFKCYHALCLKCAEKWQKCIYKCSEK